MTPRELLLARVLGLGPGAVGPVLVLSAYREAGEEWADRWAVACRLHRLLVPLTGSHTRAEAEDGLDRFRDDPDLCICTSAYHALRAWLTFLQVLRDRGRDRSVRLWVAVAPSPMAKLEREFEKITRYQHGGDVAPFAAAHEYLDWLEGACAIS